MLKVNLPLLLGCALITALPEADNGYRYDYNEFFAQRFDYETYSETVKDLKTGLEWQRCPHGQYVWACDVFSRYQETCPNFVSPPDLYPYSTYCSHVAKSMTFKEAEKVAKNKANGWRIPNIHELASIIDRRSAPAIYHWEGFFGRGIVGGVSRFSYYENMSFSDIPTMEKKSFEKNGNPFPLGSVNSQYWSDTILTGKIYDKVFYVDFKKGKIGRIEGGVYREKMHLRLVRDAN